MVSWSAPGYPPTAYRLLIFRYFDTQNPQTNLPEKARVRAEEIAKVSTKNIRLILMNHPAASCRVSNVKVPSLNGRG